MRRTILDMSDAREMFDQLLMHWSQTNAATAPRIVELSGGYKRSDFLESAVRFDHLADEIQSAGARRAERSEELGHYKLATRGVVERLSYLVPGLAGGTELAKGFPPIPDHRSSEPKFLATIDRVADIWDRLNAAPDAEFKGHLILADGTTAHDFRRGLDVLRAAFRAREEAAKIERDLREERREVHRNLISRAVQYRKSVQGIADLHPRLVQTLPYLWPKQVRGKAREAAEHGSALA